MPTLTDKQALELLNWLFPAGLKDPALLVELCPEGWDASPLRLAYHPTPEQRYKEHLQWFDNPIFRFSKRDKPPESKPPPTFDEFIASEKNTTRHTASNEEGWQELLGACLWDVLSDNHELITQEGDSIDFGSFRAVSALIDEFLENHSLDDGWTRGDPMRFYMGSTIISQRTDLRPVYRLIFSRLRQIGYEWQYSFPRIHMVRFSDTSPDHSQYDPSSAIAQEAERKKEQEKLGQLEKEMAKDLSKAKQHALDTAPPATVQAYQEVFGKDPHGWPPDPTSQA